MADNFNVLDRWAVSATTVSATGEVAGTDFKSTGLTGAVTAVRFVGGTASGAPASGTFSVGDFVVTQNGQIVVCTVAGSPGTWVNPADTRDLIDTGQETLPRKWCVTSIAPASGNVRLAYFTARKTETSTQGRMTTAATLAAATPTLCRFGVYSVASNGDLTLVAACANDTTLFAAASTAYTRSWTASFTITAGQRYAFASLVVSGVAVPNFPAISMASAVTSNTSPLISAQLTGQTDLPTPITSGSLAGSANLLYGEVLP